MSNETKRDVFEEMKWELIRNLANTIDQNGGLRPVEDATKVGENYVTRYDAALPDDLPVIPKEVGEYLKRYKLMFTLFGFLRDAVSRIDTPLDDLNQTKYHWIANNQNTFARAWVLGVWRVEETGEIVKLEEEK